jgi:hypothetical protein
VQGRHRWLKPKIACKMSMAKCVVITTLQDYLLPILTAGPNNQVPFLSVDNGAAECALWLSGPLSFAASHQIQHRCRTHVRLCLQLQDLRLALALARQLNRTLILPGLRKHYTDRTSKHALSSSNHDPSLSNGTQLQGCLKEEALHMVRLEDILDRCGETSKSRQGACMLCLDSPVPALQASQ